MNKEYFSGIAIYPFGIIWSFDKDFAFEIFLFVAVFINDILKKFTFKVFYFDTVCNC